MELKREMSSLSFMCRPFYDQAVCSEFHVFYTAYSGLSCFIDYSVEF